VSFAEVSITNNDHAMPLERMGPSPEEMGMKPEELGIQAERTDQEDFDGREMVNGIKIIALFQKVEAFLKRLTSQ